MKALIINNLAHLDTEMGPFTILCVHLRRMATSVYAVNRWHHVNRQLA